ncbi:MAG: carbon storage regulator CsrA [Bacillota bacterium]
MLVLTRKKGQSIMVGDEIEISVVEINGDAIRLGIKAPRDVSIYRREIYEAILEENIRAAGTAAQMAEKLKKLQFSPAPAVKKKEKDNTDIVTAQESVDRSQDSE